MIELIDKRKPNEKHFLKDNGNIEVQLFREKVHYLKNGKYEEISNELKETENSFENVENDYKVIFNKINGGIKYVKGDYYLEIIPKCTHIKEYEIEKNTKNISKILYKNIFANIDLEYVLSFSGVKENLIVKDKIENEKVEYEVKSNLEINVENNSLFCKNEKETIFTFIVPYMRDSDGAECSNVSYKIENDILTLSFDKDWINESNRKYPVIIDPSLENNDKGVDDTYIYPGDTNDVRYNKNYLKAGVEKVDNQDRVNRCLLKFVLPEIGTSDEIIRATLNLYGYMAVEEARELTEDEASQNTDKLVTIHEVTKDWTLSEANWNNMNNAYNSSAENVAYISRSYFTKNETTAELEPYISTSMNDCLITDLVKKWYSGNPNYGIMIKQAKEEYINSMIPMFFSCNYGEGYLSPVLTIEYRNQNGLELYLDYMRQSFTDGESYVNTFNGNLTSLFRVAYTIGIFPASIGIVYNTNDVITKNNSIYGKGYKLTYDETVEKFSIGSNEMLKYIDGDGTIHYFYELDGKYKDEDGLNLEIILNDNSCIMYDKHGNNMTFLKKENKYYLNKIKDISEREINIKRNDLNNIIKVTDYNKNNIDIIYENEKITFISPSETTILNYENDNLKTIVTKKGATSFEYNYDNIITKITDVTGLSTHYEYYGGSIRKIKKIAQFGLNDEEGESFSLSYDLFNTKVVDNNGKVTTKVFNYYGNLLSQNSMADGENLKKAYSISNSYGNADVDKNKMLSNTIPIRYSKNYFKLTDYDSIRDNFAFSIDTDVYNESFDYDGVKAICIRSTQENGFIDYIREVGNYEKCTVSFKIKTLGRVKVNFYEWNTHGTLYEKIIENTGEFEKVVYVSNGEPFSFEIINEVANVDTYIGDIQFEKGDSLSDYNAIDNSDFEDGTDGWTLSANALDTSTTPNISDIFEVVEIDNDGNKALKVNMHPYNRSSISKEIDVKGKKDDLYYLAFWFKNLGLETGVDPTVSHDGSGSIVGNTVSVFFEPVEGELEQCIPTFELNVNKESWQYYSMPFAPTQDYKSIRIELHQGRESGTLYLTNFSLFKKLKTNRYEYDENGNIKEIKDVKESDVFNYDKNNELISATNPRGKHYKVEYDNNITDRVIRAISSTGISNKIVYDDYGNPIQTKISKDYSEEITTGYYKIRQKGTNKYLKIQDNNLTLKYDYCSNTTFKVEKIDDCYKISDVVIANKYLVESNNRIILDTLVNFLLKIEQNKNASYHIYILDDKDNKKYLKWVDNTFEFVSDYSDIEENYLYEFYFEDASRLFIQHEAVYSSDGRFISSTKDSLMNETKYTIDSTNGLVMKRTLPNNIDINYSYNDKNQLIKIAQGNKEVKYSYNTQNLLSEVIQGNKKYKFIYNNFLNVSEIMLNNQKLVTNIYDKKNGKLLSTKYGNNDVINYEYDEWQRINKIVKDNNVFKYIFNNNGKLHKLSENNADSYFIYDEEKRLTEYDYNRYYTSTSTDEDNNQIVISHKNNFNTKNYYDLDNNIVKQNLTFNNELHNIKNSYNKDGYILQSDIDEFNIKYDYDELSRLIDKKINNYDIKYDYVSIGRRTTTLLKTLYNGTEKYSYKYDKMYNITDIFLNNNLVNHFNYDNYNQLIDEDDYINNIKMEYTYDNKGNILSKIKRSLDTNVLVNEDKYEYKNSSWEDLLTKYNEDLITYDEIGNPLTIGNKILSWINGRELSTYKDDQNEIIYKYNSKGLRTEKIINGIKTEFYNLENLIIYEKRNDLVIYYLYDKNGVIGLNYNNNTYFFTKNLQGDIIGIINSDGQLVAKYLYDSWGKIIKITDQNDNILTDSTNVAYINPFRYRGYYYDSESGFYYLNSRYYNPEWGRFINSDRFIGMNKDMISQNLFVYCGNSPVYKYDPSGTDWLLGDIWNAVVDIANGTVDTVVGIGTSIWDGVTSIGTGVARGFTGTISAISGMFLTPIASSLYNHSLQDNPRDLVFTNKSDIVKAVKNSNQFQDKLNEFVKNNPNKVLNGDELEVKFTENLDLRASLQNVTFKMTGTLENGGGKISFYAVDPYDFKHEDSYGPLYFINNTANVMEENGIINNYNVILDFDYCINCVCTKK